jgi:uncharacterized protein involved in outer membrane biogenesis
MTHANDPSPTPPPAAAPRKKRKRRGRKILIGLGVVLLLLVLLVVFAPTIASTGWVRGYVAGKASEQINGTISIADWSMGWTSPITLDGVSVKDAAGNEVVTIASLDTELTVLEAARQNFDIGQVVIDGLKANVVRYADGSTNLEKLIKESDASKTAPKQDGATTLPDVSGSVVIKNSGGTFRDEAVNTSAAFDLAGEVKIPDINQPITNDLKLVTRVGDAQPGTLTVVGQADIAENNELKIDLEQIRQTIRLENIDSAGVAFLVPADTGITTLAGVLNGELTAQGAPEGFTLSAALKAAGLAFGGPVLEGDVYRAPELAITIPTTTVKGADLSQARIVTGDGSEAQVVRIVFPEGQITARADTDLAALERLGNNDTPGSTGAVAATVNVDIGALARQLPNLLQINEDLRELKGRLDLRAALAMQPQRATPEVELNIRDVSAQNAKTNQIVSLQPITLKLSTQHLGGKGQIPDLRDIALDLQSGFATADINGANLGSVRGRIEGTLDGLQRELGQFVDFGTVELSGRFDTTIGSEGDLTQPQGTAKVNVVTNVADMTIAGLKDMPPIRKERVQLAVGGILRRGAEGGDFIESISNASVLAQAGPQNRPWFDLDLFTESLELLGAESKAQIPVKVVRYDLRKLNVDLVAAQQQVAVIQQMLADRGLQIRSGAIALNTTGSVENDVVTLSDLKLVTSDITANREGRTLVEKVTITLDTAGRVRLGEEATTISLPRLALTESRNWLSVRKTSGGDLELVLPASGGFAGSGQVQVGASLAFANDIASAFQKQVTAATPAGQIKRGFLDATIDLNQPQPTAATKLAVNAKINNLIVTTATGQPLDAKEVTLALGGEMAADQSSLSLANLDLTSEFATVNLKDVIVDLKTENPLGMVEKAALVVDVPDAGKAWSVYEAFVPPTAQPAAAEVKADAEQPLPPLRLTSGTLRIEADVRDDNGQTAIVVRKLAGDQVGIARGEAAQRLSPFAVNLDARIRSDAQGEIEQLLVNALDASFGFAEVKAAEPIRVVGLKTGKPDISGVLTGRGDLERLLAVVNTLGASTEKPAYAGAATFTQKVATRDGEIALDGSLDVRELRTLAEQGTQIRDEIRLVNDVRVNLDKESLAIQRLSLSMPQTQAIALSVDGTVDQFNTARRLNLKATLKTDYERLWQLAYPLLSQEQQKEYADAKFFGIEERQFQVTGSYPAGKEFNEAIASVDATGGIGIKSAQFSGLDIRDLHAPFTMKNGVITMGFAPQKVKGQYTPNATINEGILNLGNIVIDLTSKGLPTITTPENYKLAVNLALNQVLADKIFGKVLLGFNDPQQARGKATVIFAYCQSLALDHFTAPAGDAGQPLTEVRRTDRSNDAFEQWRRRQAEGEREVQAQPQPGAQAAAAAAGPGRAKIVLSISELQLGSPLLSALQINPVESKIENAEIVIEDGITKSVIPLSIRPEGQKDFTVMKFDGAVRFSDSRILNMNLAYPRSLLPKAILEALGDKGVGFLPENIMVPFTGTLESPQFNLMEAVQRSVLSGGGNPVDRIQDILIGGDKSKDPPRQPSPQPGQRQPQPPVRGDEPIGQPRQGGGNQPREGQPPRQQGGQQQPQQQPRNDDPIGGLFDLLTEEQREKEQREKERRDRQSQPQPQPRE